MPIGIIRKPPIVHQGDDRPQPEIVARRLTGSLWPDISMVKTPARIWLLKMPKEQTEEIAEGILRTRSMNAPSYSAAKSCTQPNKQFCDSPSLLIVQATLACH
ncbi:hypothetical protein NXC24_PA00254 (plasmid) [Rhizobium sp. NXC24]|nr:hypothetical protein NXC24_PA00254 [Rhizobium sp. NXC24]